MKRSAVILLVALANGACSWRAPGPTAAALASPDAGSTAGLVARRPYDLRVPSGYHAGQPTPLVVLLHGYGSSGAGEDAYFHLGALAEAKTFLYATPDGTLNGVGSRFWRATDACCAHHQEGGEDVAYLTALLDDVQGKYSVDPKRIFVVGHSNGGFMAHRLACDRADRIAAIVSLAGAQWEDLSKCSPTEPVAVLEVHGTADGVIPYDGGAIGGVPYPSAPTTIADWAILDHCSAAIDASAPNLDLDSVLPGAETSVTSHPVCAPGGAAVLWTIAGGAHIPRLSPGWAELVYGFLSAHPKP